MPVKSQTLVGKVVVDDYINRISYAAPDDRRWPLSIDCDDRPDRISKTTGADSEQLTW